MVVLSVVFNFLCVIVFLLIVMVRFGFIVMKIGLFGCGVGLVVVVGRLMLILMVVSGVVIMKMIRSISIMLMNGVMLILWVILRLLGFLCVLSFDVLSFVGMVLFCGLCEVELVVVVLLVD